MNRIVDLTGQRFGKLVVLSRAEENDSSGKPQWVCKCDCGNITVVSGTHLKRGHTKSCGCYRRNLARIQHTTHGQKNTRLYRIWSGIKDRCLNPNSKYRKNYSERGITICDEWKDSFVTFREWALSNGYSDDLTIDREDNDKGYSPDNCRWVSYLVQENNRSNNILFKVNGEIFTLSQLSRISGLSRVKTEEKYKEVRVYARC